MRQVNAAFHERDISKLHMIGAQHNVDDAAFVAKPIGEKLVWAIREVSRLQELIEGLQTKRLTLEASELAKLWRRQEAGEDVLVKLEAELQSRINGKLGELQSLLSDFRNWADEVYRV